MPVATFFEYLDYIIQSQQLDIVVGDFNMKPNFHLSALEPFEQLVTEATHLNGSILDHVYVRKSLLSSFSICVVVKCLFFTDHDAIKILVRTEQ